MGHIQSIADLVDMLRRRAVLIALVTIVGAILSVIYALNLPRTYESTAVIQIETPQVDAAELAGGAGNGGALARQVQLVEQRVMARENVLRIIDEFGLFADAPDMPRSLKVAALRESTSISSVSSSAAPGGGELLSALVVTTRLGNAQAAADVANEIAGNILRLNTRDQVARLTEEKAFFEVEAERLEAQLRDLQAGISAYKNANIEALPGGLVNRREEAAALRTELRQLDQRRLELESERALLATGEPLREVARRQIAVLDDQISVLDRQRAALSSRIDEVEEVIDRAPEVENALADFDRELGQVQERFDVVTRRLTEVETRERLLENAQAERFALLETAIPAEFPVSASRRKVAAAGAVAGGMAAVALAFLLDLLNPVLRSASEMTRQTGLTPVVTLPHVRTRQELRRRRRARQVGAVAGLAVAILLAMGIAGAYALASGVPQTGALPSDAGAADHDAHGAQHDPDIGPQ